MAADEIDANAQKHYIPRAPSPWKGAHQDTLWHALADEINTQRAAAEKRHTEIETKLKQENPERDVHLWEVRHNAGNDPEYRQHAFAAAGTDALLKEYEKAADQAQRQKMSLDEQRIAGGKALNQMADKLKAWMESGKRYVSFSDSQRQSIDDATADSNNYLKQAYPVGYAAGVIGDAIGRRKALGVVAAIITGGAAVAGAAATKTDIMPGDNANTRTAMDSVLEEKQKLLADKEAWTLERREKTLGEYRQLTGREHSLLQALQPSPLPRVIATVGIGAVGVSVAALALLLGQHSYARESVQEATEHLRTLGAVMGEVMQKEEVQKASAVARSA